MISDDSIYLIVLLASISYGYIFKISCTHSYKRLIAALFGLGLIVITSKLDTVHSLIIVSVTYVIIRFVHPRYVHVFSFVFNFSYLVFFRLSSYITGRPPYQHANAIQMMMTLKMVGIAFEVHDTWLRRCKILADKHNATEEMRLENQYVSIDVSSFKDLFYYSYCYVGIFTGPYYTYRTYIDWVKFVRSRRINSFRLMCKRGYLSSIFIILFLVLSRLLSFSDAKQPEFYEHRIFYRFLYMFLAFSLFRLRFYSAWFFAESVCFAAAFGAYPVTSDPKPGKGPTNLKNLKAIQEISGEQNQYSFETVHNIDEIKCEVTSSMKKVFRYWNMSVQFWMANYVYRRIPNRYVRQPITMLVCALWHGLYPGYYLSFLSSTPYIAAEELLIHSLKDQLKKKNDNNNNKTSSFQRLFNVLSWFCRCRMFDYMFMGFILLRWEHVITFWKSVWFSGHLLCMIFFLVALFILTFKYIRNKIQHSAVD